MSSSHIGNLGAVVLKKSVALGLTGAFLVGVSMWSQPVAAAAAASETFEFTGDFETYVVPPGVTRLRVEAWGAQGGIYDIAQCQTGGFGGYTRSDIAVTPGETLRVYVGGRGSDLFADSGDARFEGGFNGGGDGRTDTVAGSRGGGGASDVRRAPYELTDRLVVAGGGGGAGNFAGVGPSGGAGGGPVAAPGEPSPNGGGGGTLVDGGSPGTTDGTPFAVATAGMFGQGGNGGYTSGTGAYTGGGGGGGWYGGGGGGGGDSAPGGGGGGGSSYGPPGSVFQQGVNGFSGQCNEPAKSGRVVIAPTPSGGTFHPLDPERILDTREGLGAPRRKLAADRQVELQVTGRGGVPATGVAAVALNVTVDQPGGPGFVTAWPCDVARPLASSGNYAAGTASGSATIVQVSDDGTVCLYTLAAAHLIADVSGWYASDGTTIGARYSAVDPDRLVDTRDGSILDPGDVLQLPVLGQKGLPNSGVSAVTVNLTVTQPAAPGYVSAYPCGQDPPEVSNVNYQPGQTVANLATVKVGSGGQICLFTLARTHVIVDIAGWYGPAGGSAGATFESLAPDRILDSRVGLGTANQPIPANGEITVVAAGARSIPMDGVSAVVLSVAATDTTGPGFLTFYPCDVDRPTASNVNYAAPGQTVANLVVVRLDDDGRFCVYSHARTDVIADVAGYLAD